MNSSQERALEKLSAHGLTETLLLSWEPPSHSYLFCGLHSDALSVLILKRKLSPENAMRVIDRKTTVQADAITTLLEKNLYRSIEEAISETADLGYCMLAALKELYPNGLRRAHLLSWKSPTSKDSSQEFNYVYYDALKQLICSHHLRPENAIAIISGKSQIAVKKVITTAEREQSIARQRKYARILGSVMRTRSGSLGKLPFEILNLILQMLSEFDLTDKYLDFFAKPTVSLLTQSIFRKPSQNNLLLPRENKRFKRKLRYRCQIS